MTAAFTIISENYLPQAKTLAENFALFHPDIKFYIFIFRTDNSIAIDPFFAPLNIVEIEKSIDDYSDLRNRYDNFSLACALKPYVADFLLIDEHIKSAIYLDADLYFFSEMTDVLNRLSSEDEKNSIILTPHNIQINDNNYEIDRNIAFLNYGIFNAGYFAVKNNAEGKKFLNWWKRMLNEKCLNEPGNGLYCDQTWLNFVPVLFSESLCILKNPGYNIGFWNVDSERLLSLQESEYLVNKESKVVFYHFARFNPNIDITEKLHFTDHQQRIILQKLYGIYTQHLLKNQYILPKKEINNNVEEKLSPLKNIKETIRWKLIRILKSL